MLKHDKKENVMVDTVFTNKANTSKEGKTPTSIQTEEDNNLAKIADGNDMTKMGFFDKIKFGGDVSKITRTQLAEVARTMVEKQKQEITHSLMLDLDVNKKRAYQQYLDNVGILNNDLIKRSTNMEEDLREILLNSIEKIYKEKDAWVSRIDALKLSEEDHKKEMNSMNEWIDLARDQVEGKVRLLIQTHSESIKATLQLLKDTAIKGEDAL